MENERFEERLSQAMDAENMVAELVGTIRKSDLLWDIDAVRSLAKGIADDMSCLTGCEVETDFDSNLNALAAKLPLLVEALKAAKKEARKEKDSVATECVVDALSGIKQLRREIAELAPEV